MHINRQRGGLITVWKMSKLRILFLCNHNSARSQMAEGLLRHFHGSRYEAFSAGSSPTHVHPLAVKAMGELGIDISGQRSKSIAEFQGEGMDVVVSVCKSSAKSVCQLCSSPLVKGKPKVVDDLMPKAGRYIHKPFMDPAEAEGSDEDRLQAFREIRDEIKAWLDEEFGE